MSKSGAGEIDACIAKRHRERLREEGRDRPEHDLWAASVERYEKRLRDDLRMQWFGYHSQQAKRHRALSRGIIAYHERGVAKYAARISLSKNGSRPPEEGDERLEGQMERALREGDRVLAQATYLEAMHHSDSSAGFLESLGRQESTPAYRAAERYRAATPTRRRGTGCIGKPKTSAIRPLAYSSAECTRCIAPRRDTEGEGDAAGFLSDLLGGNRR